MNSWHEVDHNYKDNEINAIIEIPSGSKVKYEIDKDSGLLKVDRVLYSSVQYPCNYGFFPKTYCDDKDPLDVLVIGQLPIYPLSIMRVRPVGVLKMIDQGEEDDKVISIHTGDPEYKHLKKLDELVDHKINEIRKFFETYKELEKKSVEIKGILDETAAYKVIQESIDLYNKEFKS